MSAKSVLGVAWPRLSNGIRTGGALVLAAAVPFLTATTADAAQSAPRGGGRGGHRDPQ